jgi:hypothetical protein
MQKIFFKKKKILFKKKSTTVQDKQSYNKFAGASSISSKAFFG